MNTRDEKRRRHVPTRSGSFSIFESHIPRPGMDYPCDELELGRMFPREKACRSYLERLRFPRGFVCGHCGWRGEPWRSGTGLLGCVECRHPTPITEDTLFEGSPVPLMRWYRALWEATHREAGLGVMGVQSIMGVRSVEDAEAVLQRIRAVMAMSARQLMSGEVQVGITRLDLDSGARPIKDQPFIAIAAGCEGEGKPRVRLRQLARGTSREAIRFVIDNVEHGSCVITTSWRGFGPLVHAGYQHRVLELSPLSAGERDVQQVLSLLKLWLWSMPHVTQDQLQSYLDDFTFRYNRREYPRGLLFYRLMILAVTKRSETLEARAATA